MRPAGAVPTTVEVAAAAEVAAAEEVAASRVDRHALVYCDAAFELIFLD